MAYRDDHGHFVSKQEDGKKCTHDFETGFRSVFEERGIKVKPKEDLDDNTDYVEKERNNYTSRTWENEFDGRNGWKENDQGFYDFDIDENNYGWVQYGAVEDGKFNAGYVINGDDDHPVKKLFDSPQEAREFVEEALPSNKNKDVSVLDEYGLVKDERTLKEANDALIKKFGSFPKIDSMSNKQFNEYADFLKEKYSISEDDAKDMLAQIDEYLSKKLKQ